MVDDDLYVVVLVELKTQASVCDAVKELEGSVKGFLDKVAQKSSDVSMQALILTLINLGE